MKNSLIPFLLSTLILCSVSCQTEINANEIEADNGLYYTSGNLLNGEYKITHKNEAAPYIDHFSIKSFFQGRPSGKYEEWYEGSIFSYGEYRIIENDCLPGKFAIQFDYFQEGQHNLLISTYDNGFKTQIDSMKFVDCVKKLISNLGHPQDSVTRIFLYKNVYRENSRVLKLD